MTTQADQKLENAQFWFAAAAMNEVAIRSDDTLKALNLTPSFYVFQAWLLIATGGAVAAALVAAHAGVDVARCLVILMVAPAVTVVASEIRTIGVTSLVRGG